MDRTPSSVPSTPGGAVAGGGVGGAGTGKSGISGAGGQNGTSPASASTGGAAAASTSMAKPSLSQQILRTFRPRPSSAAAPFVTSTTASPMMRPEDVMASASTSTTTTTAAAATKPSAIDLFGPSSESTAEVAGMTLSGFTAILQDLRKPLPTANNDEREAAIQHSLNGLRTLITALKNVISAEEAAVEREEMGRGGDWSASEVVQPGPPQAEVFKACLLLLTWAKEGKLPLVLRLAVCELATTSVHLSDVRASGSTKAARETRSGAPGSQSSKAPDADHPLANIDRAALYALICHLSDADESGQNVIVPSKENGYATRLPALPMQLKALERLSMEGREVVSFPGILEFLGDALHTVWQEMQILRKLTIKDLEQDQSQAVVSAQQREEQTVVLEQLTMREWSVLSSLQLITSIIKYSFAKLDIGSIETVLQRVAGMVLTSVPLELRTTLHQQQDRQTSAGARGRKARSKSRERKPITEGYDYYGLDTLNSSVTPSPSGTPRGAQTPRLAPRFGTSNDHSAVAPIPLATLAPSSVAAAASAALAAKNAEDPLILQESEVRAALKLIDSVLKFGFMPPASVDIVTVMLCRILGHNIVSPVKGVDWTALAVPVLSVLLLSHCANASLRAARSILVDVRGTEDVSVLCGAVEFLKSALSIAAQGENESSMQGSKYDKGDDALIPTLSIPLLVPALAGALRRHLDVLDIQVLNLVSEMLPLKDGRHLLGQKLTPDDWDMLLDLPAVAKRHLLEHNFILARNAMTSQQSPATPAVIEAMLKLVDRLKLAKLSDAEEGKENPDELPWTPKLAALLLSLSPFLSDALIIDLVQYFKARHLCLPCTADWITNVRLLLSALFHRQNVMAAQGQVNNARQALVRFLFEHVYGTVQDLAKHRSLLLLDVILPLAQSALADETDPFVEQTIRRTLIEAAVTAASTTGAASCENDEESDDAMAKEDATFKAIVDLHCKMARSTPTSLRHTDSSGTEAHTTQLPHVSFADPPGSHDHVSSAGERGHRRLSSIGSSRLSFSGLGSNAQPASASVQDSKAIQSSLDLIDIFQRLAFSSPWVLLPTSRAIQQSEKIQRLEWERRARTACLSIFNALLDLVKYADVDAIVKTGAAGWQPPSTAVRLAILQWLVRLRTDGEHRVYIAGDLNELITPAAMTISRGVLSEEESEKSGKQTHTADTPNAQDRSRAARRDTVGARDRGREAVVMRSAAERSASRLRDSSRDRGRRDEGNSDSRDTSRLRSPSRGPARRTTPQSEPLWRLPEKLLFEVPTAGWRSDVVFTYMHPISDTSAHHHHHHRYATEDNGGSEPPVPMPISSYVEICIQILVKDRSWDLVSYLLCHLPHQLANKHLVCGPKAQLQVMALRHMLTTNIMQQKFVEQVDLPEHVKRSDVYAVAYGTLATMISYRALFGRSHQDELVEAFMVGLNKSSNTAQPCIRALTVACYELQKSINRHLPKMLVKLSTVMSSSTMSVHILEMIVAIGSLPSLYANFTEVDYRRIFGIALQYIQYHNQRSAEEDAKSSASAFALSQYVVMLAYYNISLWFLIIKLSDRPKYVELIRKGLLLANEGRDKVSDQTEVCFDFLSRYAHSNADPRPQKSFLNSVVRAQQNSGAIAGVKDGQANHGSTMSNEGEVTKHFLYGKGLLSITALQRAGWAELLVRRPSGTLSMLCKLENVPVSRLPDEDEERTDLPAALMMDRNANNEPFRPRHQDTLAEWVKRQLSEHDSRSKSRRPIGPPEYRRPRAASSSELMPTSMLTFRKEQMDPYKVADASFVNEEGELLQPESEELAAMMRKVLGESDVEQKQEVDARPEENGVVSKIRIANAASKAEYAIDPGFLAIQLSAFPNTSAGSKPPALLPNEAWVQRMVRAVDLTPTVDFHRIGILYVGAGQTHEREILGNRTGSTRYAHFLRGMGDLITLHGQQGVYTGGLDTQNGEHGKYAYVWSDDISQIVYHTTTLMPNDEQNDPNHARKKALIGNDWVRIVWNESGREYGFDTIKTQFNYINIIVSPNSRGGSEVGSISAADTLFYRVSLQCITGLPDFAPVGDGQLVSAAALPSFVRVLALNCSLISQIFAATGDHESGAQTFTYTSNWVSRLQHFERARTKMESDSAKAAAAAAAAAADGTTATGTQAGTEKESSDASKAANNIDVSDVGVQHKTPISAGATTTYDILRF